MDNLLLAENLYRDFAGGDIDALRAVAPDATWVVGGAFPYSGTYQGFNEILRNIVEKIPDDWTGFHQEVSDLLECAGEIVVFGYYYGKWKRTGRPMEAPFVHHLTFEDGLLVHYREFVDTQRTVAATDGFVHQAASPAGSTP